MTSGSIFTKSVQLLAYADDIDIIGRSVASVRETYIALEREANKVGLMVNEGKTKLMVAGSTRYNHNIGQNITIGDKNFEVVNQFEYLGSTVTKDNSMGVEIAARIVKANRAFCGLRRHLRCKHLSQRTRCSLYTVLIRPVLTYGCESWILTTADESKLLCFERRVLRTIFGGLREDGVFRRRYNHELERDFGEQNVVGVVKLNRLRWAGHLARMDSSRVPRLVHDRNPDGDRPRGRPKARWNDGVTQDARRYRAANWISRAQDRTFWNTLLRQAQGGNNRL